MRNQKNHGFTLIEVLAVLELLSIVLGIGIPAYYSYISKTEKESYQTAEKSMIDSAMTAMLECVNDRENSFCKNKHLPENDYEYTKITLKELIEQAHMGRIHDPKKRNRYCDEENSYAYILKNPESDAGGYAYFACLICGNYHSTACDNEALNRAKSNQDD